MANTTILCGDSRAVLQTLTDSSVQCVITSPPYFNARDYGQEQQIGLELVVEEYVQGVVAVIEEARRVLRVDGTLWLNLGDSFFGGGYANHRINGEAWKAQANLDKRRSRQQDLIRANPELTPKSLIGMPWRVVLALMQRGWILRSDIIWYKNRHMPDSAKDRPAKSHEYLFLLTKRRHYYYDADAINGYFERVRAPSVWTISPARSTGNHFAVFPEALVEPCVLAGTKPGDTVLDPFFGAGTTGAVANRLGRSCIGVELNPDYVRLAQTRLAHDGFPVHVPDLPSRAAACSA